MQIVCLITLVFVNGAYLFVSFNMESMVAVDNEEETTAVVMTADTSTEFDPASVLDLDIFDFNIEELADVSAESEPKSVSSRRTKDLVA
jgi:hypothetical protein